MSQFYDKPSACQACPAYEVGQSYVPGRGPLDAKLALIGQGPGKVEAHLGEPFKGPSGKLLSRWLERAGIPEDQVRIDNIVRCRVVDAHGKDRKPFAKEVAYCMATHIRPALRDMPNLRVLIPVGVPAQQPFLGTSGERNVGSTHVVRWEEAVGVGEVAQGGGDFGAAGQGGGSVG